MTNFDIKKAMQNKEDGVKKVLTSNILWLEAVSAQLRKISKEREGEFLMGEDIRATLMDLGFEPNHPNAWGAMINSLIKKKVLIPTDEYRPTKDPRSHGRKTKVYILTAWKS
jgi:hypothetical protein